MLQPSFGIDALSTTLGLVEEVDGPESRAEAACVMTQLGLASGDRLLDAPCGNGRHALAFTRCGLIVTGVDANPAAIAHARRAAIQPSISFILADLTLKSVVPEGSQDAIASLYSCVGYRDDVQHDAALLACFAAAVRPGGGLVLGTANGQAVLRGEPREQTFLKGGHRIHRYDRPEPEAGRLHRHFRVVPATGPRFEIAETRRLYDSKEMTSLLAEAGFDLLTILANFRGAPFDPERAPHALYFCRRRLSLSQTATGLAMASR